ncbi:unnamed protein product [Mytilus coruscus]|uniref:Uncharacterized protein n=1 Tax=Mytilus coruscus TaxID=42192 RepID=A0A6J8BT56_MYTCO|nr:unnamed protein product [Mytilus coruscus]
MEILCRLMFAICFFTMFKAGFAQHITEPTAKESNCFGNILKGNCSETNTRAFVKQVNAGAKFNERYTGNDSCTSSPAPSECCVQELNDCYGEYNAVDTDPYSYHKDCTGKNKCSERQATRMDTAYFSCNMSIYPAHTTYMDVEFYCIDVNNITPLNNGNKQNNGQGSTLYLWSGDSTTYSELTVATRTCSVETDCDGEISVLSMDFRFAPDNVNITCIEDNMLTITDGSNTNHFNCSSNNDFKIATLYTSSSNYITVTYTGTTAGGYLWLGFQTSTNGNLTINCQSPGQLYICETSTTEEPTTTEKQTATDEATTTSLQSTTYETTTGSLTSTEDQTFTTDNSSTTTDKGTIAKSETPSQGNSTGMIAGIAAAIIVIIILVIVVFVYLKIIKPRREKAKKASTKENPGELPHTSKPHTIEQGDGLHTKSLIGNDINFGTTTKSFLTTNNSFQAIENNTVPKETKTDSSKVITNDEHEDNFEKDISSKITMNNEQLPTDLTGPGTSQPQLPPLTPHLIQDPPIEKRKKKKKKKKHMKNKVEDIGNELQSNDVLALPENEADLENINENGKHSRKHKKKKKKTKTQENSSELNEQENLEEIHERKEKKKKKKKRKERHSEDSKQEEENTIITQTIEEENDPE